MVDALTATPSQPIRRRTWLRSVTDPASAIPIYVGVLVAAAGFVMLVIGWSDVAGTIDVGRQMPYLLSTGLPGIALVMVGLVLVNLSVRRQDSAERARQMSALTEALADLKQSIDS